jgi:transposase
MMSPANIHDSIKFIDVIENISDFLDDDSIKQIVSVYADKGYDAKYIRNYLRNNGINCCIPYKKNSKFILQNNIQNNGYNNYNKTRFVVERFFAWLKNGFHRTRIRYEKNCDNYLGFVYLASIMMYWRVLG